MKLPFKPELAYVIYSKGSTTRFYNVGANPQSGTVIDSKVVAHEHYDFFIVSHTSRGKK